MVDDVLALVPPANGDTFASPGRRRSSIAIELPPSEQHAAVSAKLERLLTSVGLSSDEYDPHITETVVKTMESEIGKVKRGSCLSTICRSKEYDLRNVYSSFTVIATQIYKIRMQELSDPRFYNPSWIDPRYSKIVEGFKQYEPYIFSTMFVDTLPLEAIGDAATVLSLVQFCTGTSSLRLSTVDGVAGMMTRAQALADELHRVQTEIFESKDLRPSERAAQMGFARRAFLSILTAFMQCMLLEGSTSGLEGVNSFVRAARMLLETHSESQEDLPGVMWMVRVLAGAPSLSAISLKGFFEPMLSSAHSQVPLVTESGARHITDYLFQLLCPAHWDFDYSVTSFRAKTREARRIAAVGYAGVTAAPSVLANVKANVGLPSYVQAVVGSIKDLARFKTNWNSKLVPRSLEFGQWLEFAATRTRDTDTGCQIFELISVYCKHCTALLPDIDTMTRFFPLALHLSGQPRHPVFVRCRGIGLLSSMLRTNRMHSRPQDRLTRAQQLAAALPLLKRFHVARRVSDALVFLANNGHRVPTGASDIAVELLEFFVCLHDLQKQAVLEFQRGTLPGQPSVTRVNGSDLNAVIETSSMMVEEARSALSGGALQRLDQISSGFFNRSAAQLKEARARVVLAYGLSDIIGGSAPDRQASGTRTAGITFENRGSNGAEDVTAGPARMNVGMRVTFEPLGPKPPSGVHVLGRSSMSPLELRVGEIDGLLVEFYGRDGPV